MMPPAPAAPTAPLASWLSRLAAASGLATLREAGRDAQLLCAQRFVRLFAYGASFLVLVPFLASVGIADARIGLFMTLTLVGDVGISLVLTTVTDRVGRRRVLAAGALLMAASGAVFATSDRFAVLLLASIVGVISPSGGEIGPFRAIEESVLAQLTPPARRADVFAWYALFGTAGTALGALCGGTLVQLLQDRQHLTDGGTHAHPSNAAYRAVFVVYAAFGIVKCLLTLALSSAVEAAPPARPSSRDGASASEEAPAPTERSRLLSERVGDVEAADADADAGADTHAGTRKLPQTAPGLARRLRALVPAVSHESRQLVARLLLLFAIDAFASGMAAPSWLTYFFLTVHALAPALLGTLFLVTHVVAAVSTLAALPLARRLGPLRTMAFTHLPSALCLALVPVPRPSSAAGGLALGAAGTPLAMALLVLRACSQNMDQAPRQAFLSAAVLPSERTAIMGVVNTAKTLAQAAGVGVAGILAGRHQWLLMIGGAGVLKATFDLLLLWSFAHLPAHLEDRHEA